MMQMILFAIVNYVGEIEALCMFLVGYVHEQIE